MRILIVSTTFAPSVFYGGPPNVARDHARALAARGHDVSVATTNLMSLRPLKYHNEIESLQEGYRIRYFPAHALIPHIAAVHSRALLAWLRDNYQHFDVVHVHIERAWLSPAAARLAQELGIPVILQSHGNFHRFEWQHRLTDWVLTRRIFERAACVLGLTESETAQIRRVGPRARVEVVPNGLDLKRWTPNRPRARNRTPVALFAARLHPDKRVMDFIRMVGLLRDRGLKLCGRIAGSDYGELASAQDEIVRLRLESDIQLLGGLDRSALEGEFEGADMFIHPSIRESFGLSVIEAMAKALPVVLTRGCQVAPVISLHHAGLVTEPGAENLADAVEKLLRSPSLSAELAARGRQLVEQNFSMDSVVGRLEELYRDVSRS